MLLSFKKAVKIIYALTVVLELILISYLLSYFYHENVILCEVGGWLYSVGISFYIGNQAAMMLLVVVLGFAISSLGFLKTNYLPLSVMPFASLVFGGLVGLIISDDFFNCYVFMEVSSIATYILISFNKAKRTSYKVAFDYLIVGSVAGMIVLLGILTMYVATGTLSMIELQDIISNKTHLLSNNSIQLLRYSYVMIAMGFVLKAGLYPMHTWMVKTYTVSAPTISSLMSSTVTKVFVFLLYKISMIYFSSEIGIVLVKNFGNILTTVALFGVIVMSMSNLGERNVRKEIAVSSMAQICYFTIGIFAFNSLALTGVMLQMVAHSISVSTLFLMLDSSFYDVDPHYSPRTTGDVPKYFFSRSATTKIASGVLLLTTAGYPITIGFAGKWVFLEGVASSNGLYHFVLLLISGAIGTVYTWRILERITFFDYVHKNHQTNTKQSNFLKIVSVISVFLVIALGQFVLTNHFVESGTFKNYYFNLNAINE